MNPRGLAILLIVIVIYVTLCVAYGVEGDWRRVLYWAAAAIICCVVTF